jgi:hypothetical protein
MPHCHQILNANFVSHVQEFEGEAGSFEPYDQGEALSLESRALEEEVGYRFRCRAVGALRREGKVEAVEVPVEPDVPG